MNAVIKYLFRITLVLIAASASGQYSKLMVFNGSNGSEPWGSLISDGTHLYGMTSQGGANNLGTIFKIKNDGTGYVNLLDFAGTTNGSSPYGSLFSDGTFLYGMTALGGSANTGTIFRIMPDGTNFQKLFDFTGTTTGASPYGSLISDGTFLYGMTLNGGTSNLGTIFKILKDGSGYLKLFDFTGTANGAQPYGDLLLIGTTLYGTTYSGGNNNKGSIFRIQSDGTGFARMTNFSGYPGNGERPMGSLITDGTFLYGTTSAGGTANDGTIFRIRVDGTGITAIKNFRLEQGDLPVASLTFVGSDLYGMTYRGGEGGTNQYGTIFRIKPDGTGHVKLFDFNTVDKGWLPNGSLISDGTFLYGMTQDGGDVGGSGVIFKFELPLPPTISSFTPDSDITGTVVTITGTNFSTTPGDNLISFNGWPATATASTATTITTTVPLAATSGPITVTVLGNTATSATDFEVLPGGVASHAFDWVDGFIGSLDTFLNGMATDASGNIYTVGAFSETTDFDPGAGELNLVSTGNFDGFVSKVDPQGKLEWAFRFGDVDTDNATEVSCDTDGNIFVLGRFSGNTVDFDPGPGTTTLPGPSSGFLGKYDSNGNMIWARQIQTNLVSETHMAISATNEVYITAGYTGTADFDPGPAVFNMTSNGSADVFILKLTSDGDFIWARSVGGTTSDGSRGIALDDADNIHITGFFTGTVDFDPESGISNLVSPGTSGDAFVLRLSSAGSYLWAKSFGGTGAGATDSGNGIHVDHDGNVLTVGTFIGTGDFDPGASVATLTSNGGADIFILKLDAAGNFIWAKQVGGTGGDLGYRIKTDAAGNVYHSGDYERTVDFDPGPGTYYRTASTGPTINDQAYVSKLDPSGNFIWAWSSSGSPAFANVPLLSIDPDENIILAGTFEFGTIDFDPSDCVNALTSGVSVGSFITRLSTTAISSCLVTATISFTTQPSSASGCAGPYIFNAVASGDSNLVYQWQIDDGGYINLADDATYSGVNTATLTITDPASSLNGSIYRVVVHGDNSADTPSSDATLTIDQAPAAPVVSDIEAVCPGAEVTLTASGGLDGSYRWYEGSALIPGEVNSTYFTIASTSSTTYGVVIDNGTCESTMAMVEVTVKECDTPVLAVFNAMSPNGDGKNDVFYLENIDQLESTRENKVIIYNRWGDIVFEAENYDNATSVFKGLNKNGKELPSGTYYYRIEFVRSDSMTGYISLKR